MPKLFIIYSSGRWGPEKIFGYIVAKDAGCIRGTTYKVWDVIGEAEDDLQRQIKEYHEMSPRAVRITNPLGICNTRDFQRWQRRNR